MDDTTIVNLFWHRDEAAIKEAEKKYGKYLIKIAFNILIDFEDSKEAVNDTYLKAWNSIPPQKPCILSLYMGRITRQGAIDMYRRRNSKKRRSSEYELSLSELDECIPSNNDAEQEIEAKLLADLINTYLRTLSPDARNLFVCRYYFMHSLRDSAAYCRMSEAKAKSMLYRTRIGLKKYLEKEGFML